MQRPCNVKELSERTKVGMAWGVRAVGEEVGGLHRADATDCAENFVIPFLNSIQDYKSMFNSMIYTKITSTNIDFPRHLL